MNGVSRFLGAETWKRPVLRYRAGEYWEEDDVIATEFAVTLYVNGEEFATLVCTPTYVEDLVYGFLASEGVIRTVDDVKSVQVSLWTGTARVETKSGVVLPPAMYNKRYIGSCCGKGRQSFYFQSDALTARPVADPVRLSADDVLRAMDLLDASSGLFEETGGVHVAALVRAGQLVLARADIGRHNALDKIYGHCLKSGESLSGTAVAFSGRISSEVLLKVAKIGVGVVIARGAPTALALDLAEELNITAIGFVRGQAFNVYSHPWRMKDVKREQGVAGGT
ncbi:formate dehydrogenase accessory sulfurtransferase FdhD [Alicyclobacillus vulcanalis]|uniref:Sulfur carrier protein FdhD n=1 Tax=Alicyclobacillus vulcanalis TaxID=252246 RepID=A0A1N7KVA7_9BACL|nr:formate dehydrogenase accessory sulfurtransferase FdhD [Alicyclobacillus vulcanalis]SIS65572.1 FdhD protein [Alicyclobacillus vulcanalis]